MSKEIIMNHKTIWADNEVCGIGGTIWNPLLYNIS